MYSQLSISNEQICLSIGKYVRSIEQLAVTVSLHDTHQTSATYYNFIIPVIFDLRR